MTCKKLLCKLIGHQWNANCTYRNYGQRTIEEVIGFQLRTTGFQLRCRRSNNWVTVKQKIFEDYYSKYCVRQDSYEEEDEPHYFLDEDIY